MAERDPGRVTADGRLARGRPAGPDQPRDGPARGAGARPGQEGALPIFRARPRHGAGAARAAAQATATRPAAIIARARCCSRSAFRWPTRWVRAWGWPAAIPTGATSAWCSIIPIPAAPMRCRCAAGSARNIRRRPAGRRRSTTRTEVLGEGPDDAIALVLGGDASCATGGFWSALTIATTQQLPLLIYIEDNGYGISVPSEYQTPGKDIAANLAGFTGLTIFNGDGTDPAEAARLVGEAVAPCPRASARRRCLRLTVPRLEGHSFQDTQTYKSEAEIAAEWARDPLAQAQGALRACIGDDQWSELEQRGRVARSRRRSPRPRRAASPSPKRSPTTSSSKARCRQVGGRANSGYRAPRPATEPSARGPADQHGHRDPPHARPGARGQSARCWCSARTSAPRAGSMR